MKDVAKHDRPREKLQRLGAAALGDNELVAVILGNGSRAGDALDVANRLLEQNHGLYGLARARAGELCGVAGVGIARASQILAAVELGRRTLIRGVPERPKMKTPRELAFHLIPQYAAAPVEQFGIVMFDTKHRMLRIKIVSIGSLDTTVVHPGEVFREAAAASAAAIVLFHNHPSGDPTPSPEDLAVTRHLQEAGRLLGVEVLDHLVISAERFRSLREAGNL
jgi:DNA repair protein RadC